MKRILPPLILLLIFGGLLVYLLLTKPDNPKQTDKPQQAQTSGATPSPTPTPTPAAPATTAGNATPQPTATPKPTVEQPTKPEAAKNLPSIRDIAFYIITFLTTIFAIWFLIAWSDSGSKSSLLKAIVATTRIFPNTRHIAEMLEKEKKTAEQANIIADEVKFGRDVVTTARYAPEAGERIAGKRTRVALLGFGNSGKTSIIAHWLSFQGHNHEGPDPRVKTGETRHYARIHTWLGEQVLNVWQLEVDDFRGQWENPNNPGEYLVPDYLEQLEKEQADRKKLIETLGKEWAQEHPDLLIGKELDERNDLILKHGEKLAQTHPDFPPPITAAVYICDLFETTVGPTGSPDTRVRDSIDKKHVQKFVDYWMSVNWRERWRKALGNGVKCTCIFVNKVDLLRSYRSTKKTEVEAVLKDVSAALQRAGATHFVEHGSALDGRGVPNLLTQLWLNSPNWTLEKTRDVK